MALRHHTWPARLAVLLALAMVPGVTRAGGAAEALPKADLSEYVPMPDGTRLALSLWLPPGVRAGAPARRVPTVLVQTRYGRTRMFGAPEYQRFRQDGFAIAILDTRGSTSSFGDRLADIGPAERADMAVIIANLAARPWSDGHVLAAGLSYMADTADWATAAPAPALSGALVLEADFDMYTDLFVPGGVMNTWFLTAWGGATLAMDWGIDPEKGLNCRVRQADCLRLRALTPVDADTDGKLLHQAVQRRRWQPEEVMSIPFRDGHAAGGIGWWDASPASGLAAIRRERKPVQYWGSWMDGGTAASALTRYVSAPEVPAEVWITANNHSGATRGDALLPGRADPLPAPADRYALYLDFARGAIAGRAPARRVHYYVLGDGGFRETASWPPPGVSGTAWHLGAHTLAPQAGGAGKLAYDVDYTASTGTASRWTTQFGTPPNYPDRAAEDRKLAVFDSAPLTRDRLLAGWPAVVLRLAARSTDPAVFAYLEDVAPDGRVSYLTEGMLRAVHRRLADPKTLAYDQGPFPHAFTKAAAQPVVAGQEMELAFALNPVAARLRAGHRIRLAIAGADAAIFKRYPDAGPERFTIAFGGASGSRLILPLADWTEATK